MARRFSHNADVSTEAAPGFTWRPIDRSDLPAWLRLRQAIEAVDNDGRPPSEAELAQRFTDSYVDMARGSMAAWDGDRMVGHHWMKARTSAEPFHDFWQLGGVDPEYRGLGIGTRLLDWAEQAASLLHKERFPSAPLALMDSCAMDNATAVQLFRTRGYEQVCWTHHMVMPELRTTLAAMPASPAPAGVAFHAVNPEHSEDARAVRNDSFRDHFGSTPATEETWAQFTSGPALRAANSFIAYERGEPLAIVLCEEFEAHQKITGRRDLYVSVVGTVRADRGRGIASALLAHTLRVADEDGYDTTSLEVDADSPTGALGLYERLGFQPDKTYALQRKFVQAVQPDSPPAEPSRPWS
ncbi:GNAT family N-acetyltransferase [Streptomyces sp. NPDC051662]|uniref:GNAT family N-acetyltransferase n=1 Tax=Streptomyces sp. NPDC051662 TaxID=3154750 RepID=UPI0034442B3B